MQKAISQLAERRNVQKAKILQKAQKSFSLSERDGSTADQAGRSTRGPSTAGGCPAGAGADPAGALAAFVNLRSIE